MQARISVLTLAVTDLEKSVQFYREGLGLSTEGIIGTEYTYGAVAFFQLQGDLRLALWPKNSIAHDTQLPLDGPSIPAFTIGHNVPDRTEVDVLMAQAETAGANIVKPASDTFYGGYAGYFQDPDGHLWEVVYNPQMIPMDSIPSTLKNES